MPRIVDHDQRRQAIAAALLRVASRDGLESASLRHVATEAGVTAGMVQHYFPSKDAMMRFAMHAAAERYEARMTAAIGALGPEPGPRELIRTVLLAMIPTADDAEEARIALAFLAHATAHADLQDDLATGIGAMRALLSAQLAALPDPPRDADALATGLLGLAEGLGIHVLSSGLAPDDAVAALDAHLDLVVG